MNALYIDGAVVAFYFLVVLVAGYLLGKKHQADSASDFLTGGRSLSGFKIALTMIAMGIDTGIMGIIGIAFVWGFTVQWMAVHIWITAPLAAMFIIPIYWRTKIITTPELLEKRFNVSCRAFFTVVMVAYIIIVLGTSIYLGALILSEWFGWPLYTCCAIIMGVTGLYVLMGGMKTVLSINIYQCIFIVITVVMVGIVAVWKAGGLSAIASIKTLNDAGIVLPSTLMPVDWSIFSKLWYPLPSGLIWAILAGTSWIICNFYMAQRLLASRSEKDAQKAILYCGTGLILIYIFGLLAGISVRALMPDTAPDKAYVKAIFTMFPVGVRGFLIAGLIASLMSTIDGLVTSSSTMITEDIYRRLIHRNAGDKTIKTFARITQAVIIVVSLILIPYAAESRTVTKLIQSLIADMLGVIVALYFVGIFSRRATPIAAFIGMISGILLAVYLDVGTDISFPNVGIFSFLWTIVAILVLSRFERPRSKEELENLTVYTVPGVKGPFIGLAAWPGLWKWILGLAIFWFSLTAAWEFYIRIH